MPGRRLLGTWTVMMILASLNGFAAGRLSGTEALGWIAGKNTVLVNNQLALPRTTVFQGDVINTGSSSSAIMNFHSGVIATLSEDSEVALAWDNSLNVRRGAVVVRANGQQPTRVSVFGVSVFVQAEGGFPAICRVAAAGRTAAIFNDGGRVEVHGAGPPLLLPKGKYVQLEAGSPQGGVQKAGTVNNAIPAETVQRRGQTTEIPLKIQDPVNWEDVVKTLKTGRVRIALLDGSFLNIGARSQMRITKHDPQSQQTEVEMTVGRLRGEVVKLTKPGASFEVKTQTAVIGVVGTVFLVQAAPNMTRVHCIEGLVSIRNINPAIIGSATLHAGEMSSVGRGVPPTGAFRPPASQFQAQINQTSVGPPAPGPAAGGIGAPPSGAAAGVSNVASAASTATGTTSATLSGVAASRASGAASTLTSTTQTLTTVTSTTNDATQAANQAATSTGDAVSGTQTITQDILSPVTPGCGCQ
jgi:ferric-dicitrate binding protein FerR (iron transport regulator)